MDPVKRHGWCLAAVLLLTFLSAAAPQRAAMAQGDPLVGQLLVASPGMGEAIFAHTVILVIQHGEGGALGIVNLNGPTALSVGGGQGQQAIPVAPEGRLAGARGHATRNTRQARRQGSGKD